MTRIYSYTLKLSAFLLRGRGGARFRGRWIKCNTTTYRCSARGGYRGRGGSAGQPGHRGTRTGWGTWATEQTRKDNYHQIVLFIKKTRLYLLL